MNQFKLDGKGIRMTSMKSLINLCCHLWTNFECIYFWNLARFSLTHSFPMHSLTSWKHHKTLRFSDVFIGVVKGCIGNKWVNALKINLPFYIQDSHVTLKTSIYHVACRLAITSGNNGWTTNASNKSKRDSTCNKSKGSKVNSPPKPVPYGLHHYR